MRTAISAILGLVCGAALGGGIAYVYLNKRYDKVFDIETESYRKEIKELKGRLINKLDAAKEKFVEDNRISFDEPEDITDDNDSDEDILIEEPSNDEIRYISEQDYDNDDDYEKEVFKYYLIDGVITQDDEIIDRDEFVEVCGLDAWNSMIKIKNNDLELNKMYIRNEHFETDYKIELINSSYN